MSAYRTARDPAHQGGSICAQCRHVLLPHHEEFSPPRAESFRCLTTEPLEIRPAKLDHVTGRRVAEHRVYKPCYAVNTNGDCQLYEPRPNEPSRRWLSWLPLVLLLWVAAMVLLAVCEVGS